MVTIGGMLTLFAVAIALAVIFPYQDLNEPNSTAQAAGGGAITGANGKPVVALSDGATLKSDVVSTADDAEANATTNGQRGEPEDNLIIMENGQQLDLERQQNVDVTTTTVELVVEPSDSEMDLSIPGVEVLNEEDAELSDETVGLFTHQEEEEPADDSPQVAEPEDEQEATSCSSLLQQADIDGNKMLSATEYLSFLHSIHNSNILSLENLSDDYASLSFGLRLNFLNQQCKCPHALSECCEYEKGVYVGDESAAAEFCRTTMEVGLEGKAKR